MNLHQLIRDHKDAGAAKIVMVVADGLGGLPIERGGKTELETARTPNMDALAREGVCGLSIPVLPGITAGSGPGHLGLFGYDPLVYQIGRGVLEALGINFQVGPRDVAIRGNFCTVDAQGLISDRRAGRPSTDRCVAMCQKLRAIKVPAIEVFVEPVREHRFVLVLRGDGLGDKVNDTDPQAVGASTLLAVGEDAPSQNTAKAVNHFALEAAKILKADAPTNMITLRGFAKHPAIDSMQEIYGLKPVCIAVYPMYKGLARLVGMDIAEAATNLDEQVATLKKGWEKYDFFFLHYKYTDSTGEDGNFDAKVSAIEKLDAAMPGITSQRPDVLIITGDHSTPSKLKSHSWHPVPTLLWAQTCRPDGVVEFNESGCLRGGLGQFKAKYLMALAMAHAGRLAKFGA